MTGHSPSRRRMTNTSRRPAIGSSTASNWTLAPAGLVMSSVSTRTLTVVAPPAARRRPQPRLPARLGPAPVGGQQWDLAAAERCSRVTLVTVYTARPPSCPARASWPNPRPHSHRSTGRRGEPSPGGSTLVLLHDRWRPYRSRSQPHRNGDAADFADNSIGCVRRQAVMPVMRCRIVTAPEPGRDVPKTSVIAGCCW
jgi:hypothetical protein